MPTSSSSTAEESPRKSSRRSSSSTAKKTTSTRTRRRKTKDDEETSQVDESFGDGLDEDESAEKPKRRRIGRGSSTRRTKKKTDDDSVASDSDAPEADSGDEEKKVTKRRPRRRAAAKSDEEKSDKDKDSVEDGPVTYASIGPEDFDDFDEGGEGSSRSSERNEEGGSDDGEGRPRRRRRRRRRGGGGENQGGGGRNDSRGGGGGRGGRNRGRQQGGRGGGGGRGGDRGPRRGGPRRGRQIQTTGEEIEGTFDGVLELHPKGYGFLRDPKKNYAAEDSNPFVSSSLVEKFGLREGVLIRGDVGPGTRNQGPRLREVELIDGFTPEDYANVKHFDELTPINPFEQIRLETGPRPITMRVMDLLCPIGKGQRALLVAPPRTGKTMLLQDIANAVSENHPEIHLMVLLIDERPEEVTEMRRLVNGEVISSSLDQDVESHVRIAQLIIERGKRLAECGKDVFILLDSITRLARAFNKWVSNSGRTGSGGLDIRALDMPKKLFGTARRFDEGGSLTVCGTALIETNNRMDEAIFQEFKGTGNMEMVLSRDLADRRIWPSIDITRSGTRREEKILSPEVLDGVTQLRRSLITLSPVEAMEQLTRTMEKFPTNSEFLTKIRAIL